VAHKLIDKLFTIVVTCIAILGVLPLFHILACIAVKGVSVISRVGLLKFLTAPPPPPGTSQLGGIGPALAGTLLLTILATLLGVPVSIGVSLLVVEFPYTFISRAVRSLSKTFMELPTVLLSMLVYTLVVVPMGTPSAIAGAIALALVMIPYTTTYLETYMESVPSMYREAAYSIGMRRADVAYKIIMGIARKGILLGIVMGVARALGETAPLLFTAGGSHYAYPMALSMPVDSITLLIFDFAMTPYRNLIEVAWGASLILVILYLAIFLSVKVLVKEVRY